MYIIQRNIGLVAALCAIIGFSIFFWHSCNESQKVVQKSRVEFYNSEFKNKISDIYYANHGYKIDCDKGSTLRFAIDFSKHGMNKYYNRDYSEFLFKNDSIVKFAQSKKIFIKRSNGESFYLFAR